MKIELIPHLNAIAKIMKMKQMPNGLYKGEYGTIFRRTNYGYMPEYNFGMDTEGKQKPFMK